MKASYQPIRKNSYPLASFRGTWMLSAVALFLVASFFGLLMRFFHIMALPFLEYKHLLHAHSHTALMGWSFLLIGGGYLFLLVRQKAVRAAYKVVFYTNLIACIGMAITFVYQGYGPYSIAFSTLHLAAAYLFAWHILQDLPESSEKTYAKFAKWGIYWMVISTIGIWTIGPVSVFLDKTHPLYFLSVQFYLHFQFNGWFIYAILAFLYYHINQDGRSVQLPPWLFGLLQGALVLTFALPVSKTHSMPAIYLINSAGVLLQALALSLILKRLLSGYKLLSSPNQMQNVLLLAGLTCLIVKVVVQMTGAIPAFAASSYSVRLYIVAFIHLIMLGTVSATDSGLVRLGVPRRVYTQSHIDYLFSVFEDVMADKVHAKGFRLAYEPPFLRHFTARLERVR